jgi:WD40 repeat protein/serine/threonine protein kinase
MPHTTLDRPGDSSSGGSLRAPSATPSSVDPHRSAAAFDQLTISHHPQATPKADLPTVRLSQKFGDYLIRHEVGRGGMGIVYKAYHPPTQRTVALKCLKSGDLASDHDVQRFQAESQAVLRLNHPNIVSVFDVGTQDGIPFFAMSFVEGETLSRKLRQGPWEPRASATLAETLARALAYAHQQRVIHRDLKPGNVLIGSDGQPKITDFGLAKVSQDDCSELTVTGDVLGTPKYIPPEQAAGRVREIGPASDIYSLGAILYCLLTGRPPFEAATLQETLKQVIESEPVPPTQLNSGVPKQLETICLKCLEKSPSRRYGSAEQLAEDLRRYLNGSPILARPITLLERAWRWCVRNPLVASLLTLVAVVAAIGASVSLSFAVQLSIKAKEAEDNFEQAQKATQLSLTQQDRTSQVLYHRQIQQAYGEWRLGNLQRQAELLEACDPRYRGWEYRLLADLPRRGYQTWKGHAATIACLAISPDGKVIASGSHDRTIRLWDLASGDELHKLEDHRSGVTCLAFSPDGRSLLSGSADKTVRVWNLSTMTRRQVIRLFDDEIRSLAFMPDGQQVAIGTRNGNLRLFRFNSFEEVLQLAKQGPWFHSVAISPDGKLLAAGFGNSILRIWNLDTQAEVHTFNNHDGAVNCVAFDRSGQWLARGAQDGVVKVWSVATQSERHTLQGHLNGVTAVVFSPVGTRLVSCGYDNQICEWSVESGMLLRTLRGHSRTVHTVAITDDSNRVFSAGEDETIKVWEPEVEQEAVVSRGHVGWVNLVAINPDQTVMASTGADNTIRLWDLATGELRAKCEGYTKHIETLAFTPDGRELLCIDGNSLIHTFDAETGTKLNSEGSENNITAAAFDSSRQHFAIADADNMVTLKKRDSGETVAEFPGNSDEVQCLAISPNDRLIAAGSRDKTIRVWDVAERREIQVLKGHTNRPRDVAFDPTSQRLASAGADRSIRVWDVESGKPLLEMFEHTAIVRSVAFSPDGKRIVSGGLDTHVKLWDAHTGDEVLTLRGHRNAVLFVAFTPDGRRIVSSGTDRTIRVWDAGPPKQ